MDVAEGVMKKCTLCVDRIYNDNLPEDDREPACVRTCPAGARHFGDLADPESAVSRLVETRGGIDLMPEQGTKPVNQYLPPRPRDRLDHGADHGPETPTPDAPVALDAKGFLGWLDRTLDKI
jgi:Fe-S-cluster-containing dehydrogenase component